jgi:hypothetical protein
MQPNALLIQQNFIIVKSGCYKFDANLELLKITYKV